MKGLLSKASSPADSRPGSGKVQTSRHPSTMVSASNYDILLTAVNAESANNAGSTLDTVEEPLEAGKSALDTGSTEEASLAKLLGSGLAGAPGSNLPSHLFAPPAPAAKKQPRFKRSEANANDTSKLKYPVVATEPPSPRLVLSETRTQAWQKQIAGACRGATHTDSDHFAGASDEDFGAAREPPLDWYAEELHRTCGLALVHLSHQIVSLQARHKESPGLLGERSVLRPLLFQAVSLVAGVCYHVRRAVHVLGRKVEISRGNRTLMAGTGRSVRRSLGGAMAAGAAGVAEKHHASGSRGSIVGAGRSRTHGHVEDTIVGAAARSHGIDGSQSLPTPPFAPRQADDALAALHLDVAQLQVAGQQLGVAIRRLTSSSGAAAGVNAASGSAGASASGISAAAPVDELRRLLDSAGPKGDASPPGRLQQLFLALPCLEEAIEGIGFLSYRIDGKQVLSKAQAHLDLLCSKRRDQEDADAGIVNDSAGLDEIDTGFDAWDSSLSLQPREAGDAFLGIVQMAKKMRAASAGRPESASAGGRPQSAGRPESASTRRRGDSSAGSNRISLAPPAQGVESAPDASSGEGLQLSSRQGSPEQQRHRSPSTASSGQAGEQRRTTGRKTSQDDGGGSTRASASQRQGSREPAKRTGASEKGKRKKGRG